MFQRRAVIAEIDGIHGIRDPVLRHGFAEVVIFGLKHNLRIRCNGDTDEVILSRSKKGRRQGVRILSDRYLVEWMWSLCGFLECQQISGLTVEKLAQLLKCAEPDGFGFAGLENGKILGGDPHAFRQGIQAHLPAGEHDVQVYNDWHGFASR